MPELLELRHALRTGRTESQLLTARFLTPLHGPRQDFLWLMASISHKARLERNRLPEVCL